MSSLLWYRQPAKEWEEALPLGNGRLGAMVYGGVERECIQVNEESMWYGAPMKRLNPDAYKALPRVRELLREGKPQKAEKLMDLTFSGCPESMHPYQTLGELQFYFDGTGGKEADTIGAFKKNFSAKNVEAYERSLSLDNALCRVKFQDGEMLHYREVFISKPLDCMVMRFRMAGSEKLNFYVQMTREKCFDGVEKLGNDGILLYGNLGMGGSEYAMALRACVKGGSAKVLGETLCVEDAEETVLFFTADTTWHYSEEEKTAFLTGTDREPTKTHCRPGLKAFLTEKLNKRLDSAMGRSWEEMLAEHEADYHSLYDRFSLSLEGEEAYEQEPTDVRLAAVKAGRKDRGLDRLLLDYGRYLMISCSRPGGLPATLQGLWNASMTPSWDSKYTVNINTEMNYWMAESCALSECHLPLFDLLLRIRDNGRMTAREMYGCRGFVCHHNTDINGDTVPQDIWHAGSYWVLGAAWLCTHLWTHYQYTRDQAFLEEFFPVMAEAALFFVDFLTQEAGYLAVNPSVSPENTYILPDGSRGSACIGASMDNQILRELFGDVLSAWDVLKDQAPDRLSSMQDRIEGVEDISELMEQISHCRSRLKPDQISPKYGTIQEWNEDYEEAEPGHRHISHLFALYPGTQITVDQTPEFALAARKTLERRLLNGGGHTGWSRAWIINFWAALWDGEQAYENIQKLLEISTYPNLFDRHPPFQIDGNFGVCAGICNMLAQCREDSVVLLPALPKVWETGSVKGLRLIGNASLDMRWEKGVLKEAAIRADSEYRMFVIYQERRFPVELRAGERFSFRA